MKKLVSTILAVAMVMAMSVTAFAAANENITTSGEERETEIKTNVPVGYIVTIPGTTYTLPAGESFTKDSTVEIGAVSLNAEAKLEPGATVKVEVESKNANNLLHTDGTTKIPYKLHEKSKSEAFTNVVFDTKGETTEALCVTVTGAEWTKALAGDYTDVLTFTLTYVKAK